MRRGLNYASRWWGMNTPWEILQKDFQFFKDTGVEIVCLPVTWTAHEKSPGEYTNLEGIRRFAQEANYNGLEVIIDFHILMHSGSYTVPIWVRPREFATAVLDHGTRTRWLDYVSAVRDELHGIPIHSYHMLNEPYTGSWAGGVSAGQWVQFFQLMADYLKPDRVAVRLAMDSVYADFKSVLDEIDSIMDYRCVTFYYRYAVMADLRAYAKDNPLMVAEFGETGNDEKQRAYYERSIVDLTDAGVDTALAWAWRSDGGTTPWGMGTEWNLARGPADPRLAYHELVKEVALPPLPTPPQPPVPPSGGLEIDLGGLGKYLLFGSLLLIAKEAADEGP